MVSVMEKLEGRRGGRPRLGVWVWYWCSFHFSVIKTIFPKYCRHTELFIDIWWESSPKWRKWRPQSSDFEKNKCIDIKCCSNCCKSHPTTQGLEHISVMNVTWFFIILFFCQGLFANISERGDTIIWTETRPAGRWSSDVTSSLVSVSQPWDIFSFTK